MRLDVTLPKAPRQPSGTRWTGNEEAVLRSSASREAASINVGGNLNF